MPLLLLFSFLSSRVEERLWVDTHCVCVKKNQNSRDTALILKIIFCMHFKAAAAAVWTVVLFATVTNYHLRRCECSHLQLHERDFSTCSLFSIRSVAASFSLPFELVSCKNELGFIYYDLQLICFFSPFFFRVCEALRTIFFCTIAHCFVAVLHILVLLLFVSFAFCHSNVVLLHVNTFDSC